MQYLLLFGTKKKNKKQRNNQVHTPFDKKKVKHIGHDDFKCF